jgi:hypothetical protein
VVALVLAVVLLGAFVAIESGAGQPLMPLGLFASRTRAGALGGLLLLAAAMFGMFFFLTQYFQITLGYSPLLCGFAFLPFAVLTFLGAAIVPPLAARGYSGAVLVLGTLLVIGGLVWLTQVGVATSYPGGILGPMALFGLGGGFTFVTLSLAILGGVPERDSATASGLLQAMQQVGGSVGTAVLVTFFNGAVRDRSGAGALAHGVAVTMGVAAVLAVGTLLAAGLAVRFPRGASTQAETGAAVEVS